MPGDQPPPTVNTLWSDSHIASPYGRDEFVTVYEKNDGVLQLPVAGPPGTEAVLIQLHGGYMRKKVRFAQSRAGDWPQLPALMPQDPSNEARAGYVLAPSAPQLDANGNQVLTHVEGELTFYLVAALTPEDGYRAGAPPHTNLYAGVSVINTSNFVTTIL